MNFHNSYGVTKTVEFLIIESRFQFYLNVWVRIIRDLLTRVCFPSPRLNGRQFLENNLPTRSTTSTKKFSVVHER